jgi:hypothetical protein
MKENPAWAKKAMQTKKPENKAQKLSIAYEALAKFLPQEPERKSFEIKPPVLMPGVVPAWAKQDEAYMAMDLSLGTIYDYAGQAFFGMGFPGYAYLSELTQRSEYRSPSETAAMEMTRKWIKFTSKGEGDLSKQIETLEAEFKRHKIRDLFRTAAEQDGMFGRAQIYINIDGSDDDTRKLPLVLNPATIKKGSLKGFKNIEPIWTTPYAYNSIDPAASDFFKPTQWFVLGKTTHASRLITIISREVPDMLKPAYNFGGISMTQLMEPYVNNWLRTRDAISDLIHSFSISGIKTNMASTLAGGSGDDIFKRAQLFNQVRDSRGLMLLDMEEEEFFQFNTPLGGLDALQSQAQEQLAMPCHTPLVKLLGVTPSGLNASSEGEIQVYYDYIASQQENILREPIQKILNIVQLDVFGKIDEAISFEFEPLQELTGTELSQVRKTDCDAAVAYINAGVISPEEERTRLAADPNSGYTSLEPGDLPEPPESFDTPPTGGGGDKTAQDKGHWVTTSTGSHIFVDDKDGEVLAGAGGELSEAKKELSNVHGVKRDKYGKVIPGHHSEPLHGTHSRSDVSVLDPKDTPWTDQNKKKDKKPYEATMPRRLSDIDGPVKKKDIISKDEEDDELKLAIEHLEKDSEQEDLPKKEKNEDKKLIKKLEGDG